MPLIPATLASVLVSLAAAMRRGLAVIHSWHRARRDYRILCEMDDNLLHDLGLTRSDLWHAMARPCDDPTSIVASRAAERRAAREHAEASR
jgi:uncharacterized protein YjiS (DUF1127 family)